MFQNTSPRFFLVVLLVSFSLVLSLSISAWGEVPQPRLSLTSENMTASQTSTYVDMCGKKLQPTVLYGTVDPGGEDVYWWFEIRDQPEPYEDGSSGVVVTPQVLRTAQEGVGQVSYQANIFSNVYYRLLGKTVDGRVVSPSNEGTIYGGAARILIGYVDCDIPGLFKPLPSSFELGEVSVGGLFVRGGYVFVDVSCREGGFGCASEVVLQVGVSVLDRGYKRGRVRASGKGTRVKKGRGKGVSRVKKVGGRSGSLSLVRVTVGLKPGEHRQVKVKLSKSIAGRLRSAARFYRHSLVPIDVSLIPVMSGANAKPSLQQKKLLIKR